MDEADEEEDEWWRRAEVVRAVTEPLPFVPAMWMKEREERRLGVRFARRSQARISGMARRFGSVAGAGAAGLWLEEVVGAASFGLLKRAWTLRFGMRVFRRLIASV